MVLVLVAGLVGGAISGRVAVGEPVLAQQEPGSADVVSAKQFLLIDEEGKARAELSLVGAGEPALSFYDKAGRTRASLKLLPDGRPHLRLLDGGAGRPVLSSPLGPMVSRDWGFPIRTARAASGFL